MNKIPAIPYMSLVRSFAKAKGLPFFTWNEQCIAIQLYNERAEKLN